MKKCVHCGYKNSDKDDSCNLCHNRLAKAPDIGPDTKEAFHEPRKWTGGNSPPARIERPGQAGAAEGAPPAAAPAPAAPRRDANVERHFLVPPTGEIVRLETNKVATIGRDAGCTVRVVSGKVSRHHCEIRWEGTPPKAMLHDLGSQNGTYVNERKLESRGKHPLEDGEEIEIGDVKQRYRCLGAGVSEVELRQTSAATIVSEDEESEAGLRGDAALLPIGEVLRRLEALHASGTLEVEVGANKGTLILHGGKTVSGTYAGLEGAAAVSAVASLKTGRFSFEQSDTPLVSDAAAPPAPPERPATRAIPAPPRDSTAAGSPRMAPPAPRVPLGPGSGRLPKAPGGGPAPGASPKAPGSGPAPAGPPSPKPKP